MRPRSVDEKEPGEDDSKMKDNFPVFIIRYAGRIVTNLQKMKRFVVDVQRQDEPETKIKT